MNENTSRGGFSLVEIVIAIMVLSFGMLAMAASTGYVASQMRSSVWDTQRNLAKREVSERLRAMPWANMATTTSPETVGRYAVRWNVTSTNNATRQVQIITSGPAYRAGRGSSSTVVDTTTITIVRPL